MVLRFKNPRIICTDAEGNDVVRDEEGWENRRLSFELVDPMNPSMRPVKQSIFWSQNPGFVEDWERYLPEERGGMWAPAPVEDGEEEEEWSLKMVPQTLRFIKNAEFYDYDLGGDCYQVYSRALGDHEEGEIVCQGRTNKPKVIRSITIIVQPQYEYEAEMDEYGNLKLDANDNVKQKLVRDENGKPIRRGYLKGWGPNEVGPSNANMYFPMEDMIDNMQTLGHKLPGGATFDDDDEEDDDTEPEPAPVARKPRH